ncbi:hypothetical protein PIB30_046818, partial [Stylosanthes scabra]|nr:hypothetical protein [Stylosanthes scabra]
MYNCGSANNSFSSMAVRTYHDDISLKISEDIIISLNQRGYVSNFGALCRTSSTWTISS